MGCSHLLFLSALYGFFGKMCFLYQYVLTYFAKCLILQSDIQPFAKYAVAPCVGAWIETVIEPVNNQKIHGSHPVWVRRLKTEIKPSCDLESKSHPWIGTSFPVR